MGLNADTYIVVDVESRAVGPNGWIPGKEVDQAHPLPVSELDTDTVVTVPNEMPFGAILGLAGLGLGWRPGGIINGWGADDPAGHGVLNGVG